MHVVDIHNIVVYNIYIRQISKAVNVRHVECFCTKNHITEKKTRKIPCTPSKKNILFFHQASLQVILLLP